ncbi:helix-turn-helix transcriptional regulator [Allorhizobium taibaishanense]|uniref:DNA-binding CsgD family transcriptional regulator n=2 Tax=Allorhizobium taibaishanense TaxID=887144 RepID=A0A7W6HJI4_9HYPH|nr:LuxR family transcriptional regulator [Allorhizobium taibaishanense]MBB4006396.1 DNA-binding CsgD family transcriptional regulator [Allorhizobium taibaishanense]
MLIAERQSLLSSEITAMESRDHCTDVLRRVAQSFGMTHGSIMLVPSPGDVRLLPLVLESTLPIEFGHEFDRHQFIRYCPIVCKFADSILPRTWDLKFRSDPDMEAEWPPAMRDLMMRFGLVIGVVFVFPSPDSKLYFVRFDGDRPPLAQCEMNELSMLAMTVFDQYDRLRRNELMHVDVLSARELEVVRWTAQGKTSVEIGQILSLSDHTINAYMTTAMKKLDCVNRTQLVAKAIRLKIIQ